jgi:hypothetical protein
LGAAPVWAKAGKANSAQASRIVGKSLCDTKAPLKMCTTAKNRNRIRLRACVVPDRSFRRYRVSEVCHGDGFLLAFAAFREPFRSGFMVPEFTH